MAHKELHLKVTLRIYSADDQRCFGPGIATLLQRVREHRSLRAGAASMEMAYSKAWRIIRTAEGVFGCKLLSSTIGGAHGGVHGKDEGVTVHFLKRRKGVGQIQSVNGMFQRSIDGMRKVPFF